MKTDLCKTFGIRYPIFAFTPSPAVAVAVSKAGGLGVLGAIRYTKIEDLKAALDWMDSELDGLPYGLDIVMPQSYVGNDQLQDLDGMISGKHRAFVEDVLARFGVPPLSDDAAVPEGITAWMHSFARAQVDEALRHPIKLLANALGPPPADIIAEAHEHGVLVAALAGKARHAQKHVAAGVDIVIAQGHEAGGHCGDITTMVLVPEVVDAVGDTPVLAAGGIGTGRQIAASIALGAQGVWMGSAWLTAAEFKEEQRLPGKNYSLVQGKLMAATSSDTVRSKVISGKPARMLRTPWTEAWLAKDSPGTLPMPLQGLLVGEAEARIRAAQNPDLMGTPVGQIVGQMNAVLPVAEIVANLVSEFDTAMVRLRAAAD